MQNIELQGKLLGNEASTIMTIGDYNIMILNTYINTDLVKSELFVYNKDLKPSQNENSKIFDNDECMGEDNGVEANSETIFNAMWYCQNKLRRSLR